ncbi:MAG: 23S rRNA (pseudouridine(1915)-N(3))-methyltransferase RlmH [Erysipelotrichaceae bacterium]|nr:23S rRNA (pseudouridine(1915)-N(3))-methyltransferase RlmH [Erysipelotrichaceae bacterium]MBQ9986952.1 23S rRNA (pseudouridine(1915)-N(3))-methyltransferase RlmH [Erysipelotrichales bacterium]
MIKIIAIGKLKEKASVSLVEEYAKRIKAFSKLEIIEVSDQKIPHNASAKEEEMVLLKEGRDVLSKIKDDEFVILLDLHGSYMSSEEFSSYLNNLFITGKSTVTFVIGGSLGVSKELVERSNYRFKLSPLTFPHQLVRILLVEQIYRAFTIVKGSPYHK